VSQQDHQVTPSASVLAHDLERQLRAIHDALAAAEREAKQQHRGPTTRMDALAIAREHIHAAIEALELASRE
jgi:hypothetical protein